MLVLDDDSCTQMLLMPAEEIRQRLSKYGASQEPPRDDAIVHPTDDNYAFFEKGRERASSHTNHKYTMQERKMLGAFESLEYLPSHSSVYKDWLKRNPAQGDWQRWLMMALIGFCVGIIGFLLHQIIDSISTFKWNLAREYLKTGNMLILWSWVTGFSVSLVLVSAGFVVFLRPQAASSGIPELMGFLNGTVVRHIFNVKTLFIKFFSCVLCVGSGMPVGPEGPMIHMGSLVGAGLSQFKSDTMKFKLPCFERFRNFEDRRNFISAGAAAGVASAFGAPVGGMLFSMEEVSSFWNMKLTWQIFFCAMIATFTTDLFNSAFEGFQYKGNFGLFRAEIYILYQVTSLRPIPVNILAFIPAVLLGFIGGILGGLFTFLNLKIVKTRRRLLAGIRRKWKAQLLRLGEPALIMLICATVSVFLPALGKCDPFVCMNSTSSAIRIDCLNDSSSPMHIDEKVQMYNCPYGVIEDRGSYFWTNRTYNKLATLVFGSTEKHIHHLFSRDTHVQLDVSSLSIVLVFYFIMACWAAGTSISSGILVPMLYIGGLYGRIVGVAMVNMFGVHSEEASYWSWIDPGVFALVGSASFFGGVSRLTMSLAVILIEMTNDVQFLLPIMAAIMVSKWVGDFFTHSYYLALIELKCIPYLEAEPVVTCENKSVNLELHCARDIMARPPVVIHLRENVMVLADLLLNTNHGGFPVVRRASTGTNEVYFGTINRLQLTVLLKNSDMFTNVAPLGEEDTLVEDFRHVDYPLLTLDKLEHPEAIEDMLLSYVQNEEYKDMYINLEPYVNQSAVSIPEKFSLERTYIIFRTLGLRHMTVVDDVNHVVGIITRKDLMGYNMEERLTAKLHLDDMLQ